MNPMTPITSAAQTPVPATGSRRTGLLVAGVFVLAAGMIAAALLWFAGGWRNDDAIRRLARAPVGCDTTLNFAEAGTYLVFAETQGTLGEIEGTCPEGGEFATTGDVPALRVYFVDDDGEDLGIDLPRRTDVEYSGAGAVGESIRSFTIDAAGDYTLRVQSPGDGVAIAIGPDPSDGVSLLRNLAVTSAILGVIGGGVLLVLSTRRSTMTVAPESAQWSNAAPPTSPPGMGQQTRPTAPGWQVVAGPPTTLRPPDNSPSTTPGWAAPTPSQPPQPAQWTAPDTGVDRRPTPPEPDPSGWEQRPRPPATRGPGDGDDSSWAPPSD